MVERKKMVMKMSLTGIENKIKRLKEIKSFRDF